jgi:ribosomal protein S18 acetylase RimI-like enzyme
MIRQATPEDAAQTVPLICAASGNIAETLAGTRDGNEVLRVLGEFFQQEGNRLSYRNTLVAERQGVVVGALVSYHGSRCEELDRPFLDRQQAEHGRIIMEIAMEAQPDEYYLDSIAVAESVRGQGIATALIARFEQLAIMLGYDKVALLAEESNKPAYRLYRKLGYITDGVMRILGTDYQHMVKILPGAHR